MNRVFNVRPQSAFAVLASFALAIAIVGCAPSKPPVIKSFDVSSANLKEGESAVFSWEVTGASEMSIDQGVGPVSGINVTVNPAGSATYTLTAKNGKGETQKSVSVSVKVIPRGDYFGVKLPGDEPEVFQPDAMKALSPFAEGPVFSPDGNMLYINVGDATYTSSKPYFSQRIDNVWTPFAEAPFMAGLKDAGDFRYSQDGKSLQFCAQNPPRGRDIFEARYDGKSWSAPVALPSPINSEGNDFNICYTKDGIGYLGSERSGGMQVLKVYKKGGKTVAEALGPAINASGYDGDPCVAPDGRFLVYYTVRKGANNCDLYVCFADGKGGWGEPVRLGAKFNSGSDEYGAHLSPDGKYMFFTRHTRSKNTVYWVAVSGIDKYKP